MRFICQENLILFILSNSEEVGLEVFIVAIPESGEVKGKARVILFVSVFTWSFFIVMTVPLWATLGELSFILPVTATLIICFIMAFIFSRSKITPPEKDGTTEGYGMKIYPKDDRESYVGRYQLPERCSSCNVDFGKTSLDWVDTLTVKCPECGEKVDCLGKPQTEYYTEG